MDTSCARLIISPHGSVNKRERALAEVESHAHQESNAGMPFPLISGVGNGGNFDFMGEGGSGAGGLEVWPPPVSPGSFVQHKSSKVSMYGMLMCVTHADQ